MKKTESNRRLIAALEEAAAGTSYKIETWEDPRIISLYVTKHSAIDWDIPRILFDDAPYGDESASTFKVLPSSPGAVTPEKIDRLINDLRAAADLAKTLTALVRQADQEEAAR